VNARYVRDDEELFNLRHASARNVVERIFGVMKKRFPILDIPPQYSIGTQATLLPALAALQNWLRVYNNPEWEEETEREVDAELERQRRRHWPGARDDGDDNSSDDGDNEGEALRWRDQRGQGRQETPAQRVSRMNRLRKTLSQRMWADKIRQAEGGQNSDGDD
jgi:hypothetical protein